MRKNQGKNNRSFRWLNLLILVAVLAGGIRLGDKIVRYHGLQNEATAYTAELAQVESVYQEKLEKIELLNNDAYLERVARENLGMVKRGETVVSSVRVDINQAGFGQPLE